DDLPQARQAVRARVLAHLDANPASAHLVRDGGGGAGAKEAVEDEIIGVCRDVQDAFHQPLWLWRPETYLFIEKNVRFLFCFVRMPYFATWPPRPRRHPRNLRQVANDVWLRVAILAEVDPACAQQSLVCLLGYT